ncbi:hypothetical protein NKR19_g1012 [Coniochaeta hoffmannii]|uniref:Chromo domain-containing protein n=1 Tax=Coniochaeta hoffmannii TaxID=91930 RepID=A0AA38S815_9PEZI|nr:hypothetical protein NKR19_g1012 [Coniochaeta hoffmannii]
MAAQQPGRVKKFRRVSIEIPLPSRRGQPKRLYRAGPPPPPIALVPPRDSTAYIVNKLVLPSHQKFPDLAHTQRRLYYTVGWTDLPSARIAVLASRILDYVSPREVEEWEYNDFLRREEEKKLAQEKVAATPKKKKRKSGRPRKGPAESQREAEAAATEELAGLDTETEAILAEKSAAGGPSLSTPSKRKLEELLRDTEAEETGTDDENAALRRQLYSEGEEAGSRSEAQYGDEMDIDSEAVDLIEPAAAGASSRASSLAAPLLRASFARASPAPSTSQKPSSADSSSVAFPSAPPSLPGTRDKAPPAVQVVQSGTKGKEAVASATRALTPQREPKTGSRASTRTNTPQTSPYFSARSTNGASGPRRESTGFTPVITARPMSGRASSATQPPLSTPKPKNPSTPRSPQSPATEKRSSAKKRRKPKHSEEAEQEWKVKRLEADKYDYDDGGNLVRYFKVLWDGDWPAWQNPSWEPEANVSEDLKEEYLRKKEAKMKDGYLTAGGRSSAVAAKSSPARGGGVRPPPFLPKKRYSSVAEAFEGGIDEVGDAGGKGIRQEEEDDDDGDGEEEFVVTDEPQGKLDKGSRPNYSGFDQNLASYRYSVGKGG